MGKDLPFVSIIIPCLNRKVWMQEQIAALRAQTYPHDRFEIVVVDGGSKDGLWEWLQQTRNEGDVAVQVIHNDTPLRIPEGSRNVGLRAAKGAIIGFTDSDCIVDPAWIENAVARFRPNLGIVVGRTIPPPWEPIGPFSRVRIIENEHFYDTCNLFYSREAIDRVGQFEEDFAKRFSYVLFGLDSDLGLRVKEAGYESLYAEEVLVMHRVRSQSAWQWLIEPRVLVPLPYLARRHPVIGEKYLTCRYFLNLTTALFDLALLGLILGLLSSVWFLLLVLPFVVHKGFGGDRKASPVMRLAKIAAGSVRGMVTFGVLVYASCRFRRVVI